MKYVKDITAEEISMMSYNELIGLTRETNRTPGGESTIKLVSRMLLLNKSTKILDIGTSTGHSAIEFARLLNCTVVGIDINEMSLAVAKERSDALKLDNVQFLRMDATDMNFGDESFDVVFAGNVTSLIENKDQALAEYWRVLKPNGYLVAVPMYYIETPSENLVQNVRDAIKVNIKIYNKNDWKKFFVEESTEIFEEEDFKFIKSTDGEIEDFCKRILEREHLNELTEEARAMLHQRYKKYMHLFNENLSHMGFTVFVIRHKESAQFNDPQLYFSEHV